MTAVGLSLAAALTWGFSDFGAGLKSRRLPVAVVILWVEGAGALVAAVLLLASGDGWPDGRTLLFSVLAGICGVGGLAAFYRALSIGTMSIVAPISATGVTLPVVVGLVTGDTLGFVVAVGLAVVFTGVILASREEALEEERATASRTAILLALVAAAGFGGLFTFGDVAADGSILWLLFAGRVAMLPLVVAVVRRQGHPLLPPRPDRPVLFAIGMGDLAATGLYGLANTHGALAVVSVVGSLYPVITILLARLVLHERIARLQMVGVVTALVGVGLVSTG